MKNIIKNYINLFLFLFTLTVAVETWMTLVSTRNNRISEWDHGSYVFIVKDIFFPWWQGGEGDYCYPVHRENRSNAWKRAKDISLYSLVNLLIVIKESHGKWFQWVLTIFIPYRIVKYFSLSIILRGMWTRFVRDKKRVATVFKLE